MADNTILDAGSGGDTFVTREISHAGDTAKLPGCFVMAISGTEGAYTAAAIGGDAANGLDVDVTRVSGTVTISGAVTNAGTFVVQENGGSLTALQIIDDWDESDRCKSNIIVGQAGITAGAGAVAASTPRVTLASDDPAVAALQIIDNCISGNEAQVDVVTMPPITIASAQTLATVTTVGTVTTITNVVHVDDNGGALTVDGTVSISGTVTVGSHAVTNAGTFAVQVDGSALTALQLIDDCIFTDDAAFTPGTSKVAAIGLQADEASTDSVDEGDVGCPRMTLDRKLIATMQPHTAGGLSVYRSLDLDESEEEIKATAGCLYKLRATNRTTSVRYLKLYNATAANVTVGSTAPIDTIPIPANASDYTVLTESFGGLGLTFDTALSAAVTTGFADNDTGAPGANDVIASFYYK